MHKKACLGPGPQPQGMSGIALLRRVMNVIFHRLADVLAIVCFLKSSSSLEGDHGPQHEHGGEG